MSAPSAHPNRRRSPSLPAFPHVPVSSTYSSSFATLARRQLSLARGKVYEVGKEEAQVRGRVINEHRVCLKVFRFTVPSTLILHYLPFFCSLTKSPLCEECWWLLSFSSICGCWPSLRRLCALTLNLPQYGISSWAPTDIHTCTRFTFEHVSWVECVINYCGCVRLHMCRSQM